MAIEFNEAVNSGEYSIGEFYVGVIWNFGHQHHSLFWASQSQLQWKKKAINGIESTFKSLCSRRLIKKNPKPLKYVKNRALPIEYKIDNQIQIKSTFRNSNEMAKRIGADYLMTPNTLAYLLHVIL